MTTTKYHTFTIGSTVALIDYSNDYTVHTGTVTNVTIESNGYPTTTVNLPTFRGERVYAIENLLMPEAVEAIIAQHKNALRTWR